MIVLSVGMPRAGSGWHYNLTHDLVVASGGVPARAIRRRFRLGRILTEVNCNIGTLSAKRLLPVLVPGLLGSTFVIKAHAGPKPLAKLLIRAGLLRTTYIYRDPRAALLSAYEYGRRAVAKGRPNAFSPLENIDMAIDFIGEYVRIWQAWMAFDQVLHVRYEDLLADYDAEITRLLSFLRITANEHTAAVVEQYRPGHASEDQQGLHFHKGQAERFRDALSAEQLAACARAFGPVLEQMGYVI
ncbi:MAG: sulfotransferase domain-containing protein [Anaerolineae bacterium]|nr:sulfotransferase domain-containing protein [Anaerolineae bacterium]